jgi:hypothetical protein
VLGLAGSSIRQGVRIAAFKKDLLLSTKHGRSDGRSDKRSD